MKTEQLTKAKEIENRIEIIKEIVENANTQKTEWVEFTFGNGSNRKTVCDSPELINIIRYVINGYYSTELSKLEKEFDKL
jgi:hypothetical protein